MQKEMVLVSKEEFKNTAVRVSRVSILGNAVLSALKLFAGIFAHSGAMVSDAMHSASDVFSSIIVIIGVKLAAKDSDEDHPYGHERIESVAAVVLSIVLFVTSLFIGRSALELLRSDSLTTVSMPGLLALVAAVISIICKEAMYWYTRFYAKSIGSDALMADAWHHRSDALSSVGSFIGILGSRLGYAWFDPVASLIICAFILKAAYDIFTDAIQKMTDHACSAEMQQEMAACAAKQEGVLGIRELLTREFGNRIYVDLEILVDGHISVKEGDEIASRVHDEMEETFPKIKHIVVIVKPKEENGEF